MGLEEARECDFEGHPVLPTQIHSFPLSFPLVGGNRWESVEQLTWEEEAEALAALGMEKLKQFLLPLVHLLLCVFSLSSSVSTVDLTAKFLDTKDRSKITCYNLK